MPARRWAARWRNRSRRRGSSRRLARVFDLAAPPQRIEVYDNSHIQGRRGGRRHDRRRARRLQQGPIPKVQHQVGGGRAGRRFRHDARGPDPPFLAASQGGGGGHLLRASSRRGPISSSIDGGQGQLGAVKAVLEDLGMGDLCIVGVAKGPDRDAGREHFYVPEQAVLHARFARPCALLYPAIAGRGAPLRHRQPPRQACEGDRHQSAGRDSRDRPAPQEGAPAGLRLGQGGQPGEHRRSGEGRGREQSAGDRHIRLLPRRCGKSYSRNSDRDQTSPCCSTCRIC